jgi:hypothetical protein
MTEKTYTGKEFASVFYRAMVEWYEGECEGDDPRCLWEANQPVAGTWAGSIDTPSFNVRNTYRWKPKQKRMVTIGWYSVDGNWISKTLVAPETVTPGVGTIIYLIYSDGSVALTSWTGEPYMLAMLKVGTVFLTCEDAQAMADWLAVCRNGGDV